MTIEQRREIRDKIIAKLDELNQHPLFQTVLKKEQQLLIDTVILLDKLVEDKI